MKTLRPLKKESPDLPAREALAKAAIEFRQRHQHNAKPKKLGNRKRKGPREIPDHIRRTILKQRKAEEERKREGRELPEKKATFVSGGSASPR